MNKLIAILLVLACTNGQAQTLFRYGNHSVSAQEFLNAYNKNNPGVQSAEALQEYLDLYIASRLKIAEAKSRHYDTLPQLVADLENLRQQILPSYATDKESVNKMVDEAFERSQKDIHLAHIFIACHYGVDTVEAKKKLATVQQGLAAGTSFAVLAREYSDDPAAKTNSGDLGFITVFTLPYDLENLAYHTPVGKTSNVYRSAAGFHIFKNLEERKTIGRMQAAQILLAFPPDADETAKMVTKRLADSVYKLVQAGEDFAKLATTYSNDVISAVAGGKMQEFGTAQYDIAFEKEVFALPEDGAITKPFATAHGYHIVKRLGKTPISSVKDEQTMGSLREEVERSDRMHISKALLAKKLLQQASFKKTQIPDAELWAYSDSVLNHQLPKVAVHISANSPLFTLGAQKYTATDWINYAQAFRFKPDGSGIKPYPQVWDEFVEATALQFYQDHLEDYNPEFRLQMNEFKDGNLFFEIMQRQVWGPAQSDSAALARYFNQHKAKYNWKQSADAVIFYASDEATAKSFIADLKKAPENWLELVSEISEKVAADSSRFEAEQIPNPTHLKLTSGTITDPLVNTADHTASFAYIVNYYPTSAPRSFADAKGLVITDYQNELEQKWLTQLKKKYPVSIDQKVLNQLKKDAK